MSMLRLGTTFVFIATPEQAKAFIKNFDLKEKQLLLEALHNDAGIDKIVESSAEMLQSTISGSNDINRESVETFQKVLYADVIVDSSVNRSITVPYFNRVREIPNEDSFFELKCTSENYAKITIHPGAYKKILANPSFLSGTKKQVLGSDEVIVEEMGEAQRGIDGKRVITKAPVIILA